MLEVFAERKSSLIQTLKSKIQNGITEPMIA